MTKPTSPQAESWSEFYDLMDHVELTINPNKMRTTPKARKALKQFIRSEISKAEQRGRQAMAQKITKILNKYYLRTYQPGDRPLDTVIDIMLETSQLTQEKKP